MHIFKRILFLTIMIVPAFSLDMKVSYNDVKAVFIERFTRFIDWPQANALDKSDTFKITVLNETEFFNTLLNIYSTSKIKNKDVQVKHISDYKDIKNCHLLFIGRNQDDHLDNIFKIARDRGILTISDKKGYAQQGAQINFYLKENQVRFEINEKSMEQADFTTSYLLLNVAKIVNDKK